MNKSSIFILLLATLFNTTNSFSQEQILYKQIDTTKLFMKVYYPEKIDKTRQYPAIVFFFGGGWTKGDINQFTPHANYFSKRGLVCFLVDYRVTSRHQSTPFESLKDAKSAIRYIRQNAATFHIDTSKIVASGGSAGGQLAAAAALIEGYNDDSDNVSISSKPNALVLFNPAIDNGPGGVGHERIGDAYKNFSPLHNIKKGAPPTIIFQGTNDHLIPVETVKYYQTIMRKVESRCELFLYEGEEHGFFNYNKLENYKTTVTEADNFLQSLDYLKKDPIIEIK